MLTAVMSAFSLNTFAQSVFNNPTHDPATPERYYLPKNLTFRNGGDTLIGKVQAIYDPQGFLTNTTSSAFVSGNEDSAWKRNCTRTYNSLHQLTNITTVDPDENNRIVSDGTFTYETLPFFGTDTSLPTKSLILMYDYLNYKVCVDSVFLNYDAGKRTIELLKMHMWFPQNRAECPSPGFQERTINTFDERWNPVKTEEFYKDYSDSVGWIPSSTTETTFDDQNRPVSIHRTRSTTTITYVDSPYRQTIETTVWDNGGRSRTTTTWNQDGHLLERVDEYLNRETNEWETSRSISYSYDANGWLLTDDEGVEYTYDSEGNCISVLGQRWELDFFYNRMRNSFRQDCGPQQIMKDVGLDLVHAFSFTIAKPWDYAKMTIEYLLHVNLDEVMKADFSVFPNPCKDKITIQNVEPKDQILLLDMNGRTLRYCSSQNGETVLDLTRLPQGTYVLQLIRQGHTYDKKIVKQ